MSNETLAILATLVVALTGYLFKFFQDRSVARRKDRLDRINLQLRHLYGPLYSIHQASEMAWVAFRSKYRPRKPFFGSTPGPTEEDLEAWRMWMSEVFMPLNLQMEKTIVDNGDLIIEDRMPQCLLELCAHVDAYKVVLKKWSMSDFSEHIALSTFPREYLTMYIEQSYTNLKKVHASLLGLLKKKRVTHNERPGATLKSET